MPREDEKACLNAEADALLPVAVQETIRPFANRERRRHYSLLIFAAASVLLNALLAVLLFRAEWEAQKQKSSYGSCDPLSATITNKSSGIELRHSRHNQPSRTIWLKQPE
jgi:hypothetical protein